MAGLGGKSGRGFLWLIFTGPWARLEGERLPYKTVQSKKFRSILPTKKSKNRCSSQSKITFQRVLARTSTGERRPCGLAYWMFLIFLLLFGSSQKEGERFPNKTLQSKKLQSPPQPTKAKNQRSPLTTDTIPACVGPNIHGGAEAMGAGRLDVLDHFASFWIKPKRRRTAAPENCSVKKASVHYSSNSKRHAFSAHAGLYSGHSGSFSTLF